MATARLLEIAFSTRTSAWASRPSMSLLSIRGSPGSRCRTDIVNRRR
jgi:hypothetical protein